MATITPNHSTQVVLAVTTLTSNTRTYATLDLRGKYGAGLIVNLARLTNANFGGSPFQVKAAPTYGNKVVRCASDIYGRMAVATTACNQTTISGAMTGGTTDSVALASGTGFNSDTLVAINPGGSTFEVIRVSRAFSGTLYFDAPCLNSHSSGETIVNLAESWTIDLPGGHLYEICFDYGAGSGPSMSVMAHAMIHDYDTIT